MPDPMIEALERQLPDGWTLYDRRDPFAGVVCPHGNAIEVDGSCPQGCESPFKLAGLV